MFYKTGSTKRREKKNEKEKEKKEELKANIRRGLPYTSILQIPFK